MTSPQFLSKLNWRLILIHLVACWLFINAFRTLSYLHDPELVAFIRDHQDFKDPDKFAHELSRFGMERITDLSFWVIYSAIAGLFAGLGISLFIAIKKHWYWLNSMIVFVALALLGVLKVSVWYYLNAIFLKPGSVFKEFSIGYFLINGSVMLALGSVLFFSNKVIVFINSDWPKVPKDSLQNITQDESGSST